MAAPYKIENNLGIQLNNLFVDVFNVGIGITENISEKLEIDGAIKIGLASITPSQGTIEWDGSHFRGYNGSVWVNLDDGFEYTADNQGIILTTSNEISLDLDGNTLSKSTSGLKVEPSNISLSDLGVPNGIVYLNNQILTNSADPINDSDLATKGYVDNNSGKSAKLPCRLVTDNNINFAAAPNIIDGVSVNVNDRILVKSQTDPKENGIYVVTSAGDGSDGLWSRSDDFDGNPADEILGGSTVFIQQGSTHAGNGFVLIGDGIRTLGVNNIIWEGLSGSGTGEIGPAEDGTYTDGIFTDFTENTLIGTAVDRFNELFTALVPPLAPSLSDWNGSKSGDVSGKLSFDSVDSISGYVNANIDQGGVNPGVSRNGTWSITGKRLGITSNNSGDISGILNYQVLVGPGSPTAAYAADSFGDAQEGTLNMYINGNLVSSVDLTNTNAQNNTSGSTISGFNLSAAVPSYFPGGDSLSAVNQRNRTGTWLVVGDDSEILNGYNYVIVIHSSTGFTRTLSRFEWIQDDSTTATSYINESLDTLVMTGSKYLSGVEYYTGGTAEYNITIQNAYSNTYSSSASAISHNTVRCSAASQAIPALGVGDNELSDIDITSKTVTINNNIRLIDESISCSTTVLRTLQSSPDSVGDSISNILMDSISESSSLIYEDFNGETYRLISADYDTYGTIATNTWDSTESIYDAGNVGYNNSLQVIDDTLVYPSINFSTILNGPSGNVDYSGSNCTGDRYYYRYFRQVSPTVGNFVMNIQGSGGTFVPDSTALTGNNIHVHIKAPGSSSSETGWLDAYQDFATGQWSDGDGARNSTAGSGRNFNINWGLTIGTKNTANTNGYIIIRITVGESFTGAFNKITFNFG